LHAKPLDERLLAREGRIVDPRGTAHASVSERKRSFLGAAMADRSHVKRMVLGVHHGSS
jgi:hypothetical protein